MITLIKRKVSACDELKIRVRKRETKIAIFTEIQIFGIFFSLDLDTPSPPHTHRINHKKIVFLIYVGCTQKNRLN